MIKEIGTEIFKRSQASSKLFKKNFFSDLMMDWAMKREDVKVEMFRFVDVLPTLKTNGQISDHLREYFLASKADFPQAIQTALKAALSTSVTAGMTSATVKKNVSSMASVLITGEDSSRAQKKLKELWDSGYCFTVDILGEAVVSEAEAVDYQNRYLELARGLPKLAAEWKPCPLLEETSLGKIPRANVSVKPSSLYSQIDPVSFDKTVRGIKDKLRPILSEAVKNNCFVNIDMEQNDYREIIFTVCEEIFSEAEFVDYPHLGIVVQAYLKSAEEDLKRLIEFSQKRKAPLTIRLVKGAYWDYEIILAKQRNWPIPVFTKKPKTDISYEQCTKTLLDNYPKVIGAFASHNVRSLAYAMACAKENGIGKQDFELQTLYGMANNFKKAIWEMGYRIREYAPVGEMLPGMSYLVRRLLENTSNDGFLKQSGVDQKGMDELLRDPRELV
ncbi:MAG: proline dehydrogenase family protein [Deltaproteobacteria bacterium]|nr:proline dehydrogenase family protein [Deltaproteobacteria bacterium]